MEVYSLLLWRACICLYFSKNDDYLASKIIQKIPLKNFLYVLQLPNRERTSSPTSTLNQGFKRVQKPSHNASSIGASSILGSSSCSLLNVSNNTSKKKQPASKAPKKQFRETPQQKSRKRSFDDVFNFSTLDMDVQDKVSKFSFEISMQSNRSNYPGMAGSQMQKEAGSKYEDYNLGFERPIYHQPSVSNLSFGVSRNSLRLGNELSGSLFKSQLNTSQFGGTSQVSAYREQMARKQLAKQRQNGKELLSQISKARDPAPTKKPNPPKIDPKEKDFNKRNNERIRKSSLVANPRSSPESIKNPVKDKRVKMIPEDQEDAEREEVLQPQQIFEFDEEHEIIKESEREMKFVNGANIESQDPFYRRLHRLVNTLLLVLTNKKSPSEDLEKATMACKSPTSYFEFRRQAVQKSLLLLVNIVKSADFVKEACQDDPILFEKVRNYKVSFKTIKVITKYSQQLDWSLRLQVDDGNINSILEEIMLRQKLTNTFKRYMDFYLRSDKRVLVLRFLRSIANSLEVGGSPAAVGLGSINVDPSPEGSQKDMTSEIGDGPDPLKYAQTKLFSIGGDGLEGLEGIATRSYDSFDGFEVSGDLVNKKGKTNQKKKL